MENIAAYILAKYNIFIYGVVTGALFQYFEIQAGNVKFNIGKFIFSSCAFWVLTEFSHLVIEGGFIAPWEDNESRIIVLSIVIASFLYLFIPFILKPENRGQFIESVLNRFWFEKKDNKDMFK